MAISPQWLTIYLYSTHRAVIFAIAQLSCLQCFDLSRTGTHRRTDGIGLANGANFIDRQTVELCTEIDHWFIQQSIATVQRSKERATIGLCWSEFFVFSFYANISAAAAVADDYKLRSRISTYTPWFVCSVLHFFFGRRIWRPFPYYSCTTHVHLSVKSPSPPTYTFNCLVFHSKS